jgi:hypothetical protein
MRTARRTSVLLPAVAAALNVAVMNIRLLASLYDVETSISNFINSCRVVLLGGLLLSFFPIAAAADQIVVLTDNTGHKVFVNTSEITTRVDSMPRSLRAGASATPGPAPANIDQLVEQTARRYQVDPELVRAVIRVESGYNTKAVSNKGAKGLMQLIPATAHRFGVVNAFDPKQNLEGGVQYLKYLLEMFGGDLNLALAAYNAGEHAVERSGGIPPIPETQDYVRKVTHFYKTGNPPLLASAAPNEPPEAPITRYVDENGMVHFSNVD